MGGKGSGPRKGQVVAPDVLERQRIGRAFNQTIEGAWLERGRLAEREDIVRLIEAEIEATPARGGLRDGLEHVLEAIKALEHRKQRRELKRRRR